MNVTATRAVPRAGLAFSASLLSLALAVEAGPARAEDAVIEVPPVRVEGEWRSPPTTDILSPDDPWLAPSADGGEFLRSVPGVSAGRMGGHGLEPVIRGQQQNRLNILNDGTFVFGACPNRMDPPTAYVSVETFDKVTVVKGYQSVLYGPGGSGGTVLFEREPPAFAPGKWIKGRAGAGYETNGRIRDAFADAAVGGEPGFVRGIGAWKDAGNYRDGAGAEVRSAFETRSLDFGVGWRPDRDTLFQAGVTGNRDRDVLFAGAGMDTPRANADAFRFKARHAFGGGPIKALRVEGYASRVDHLMDNYSLRPLSGMAMRADSDSDTFGGRAVADAELGGVAVSFGMDALDNIRDGRRFRGMKALAVNQLQSAIWPDVDTRQVGVFAEATVELAVDSRLKLGARYDRVRADAGAAGVRSEVTGRSADDLYRSYYGIGAETATEDNVGGLIRLEHDLTRAVTVFGGLSRSVRTADATERFMASDMMASSWVGNPAIAPEKHHALDLGVRAAGGTWTATVALFGDRVEDFILRDTARGQPGILMSNGATIYRNVPALLAGGEIEAHLRPFAHWHLAGTLAYTYGQNLDTDRPLAQIPPLEGVLDIAYEADDWTIGGRMRAAAKQTRVDANPALGSGLDVRETPGYAVFDLYGAFALARPFEIRMGVTNILDATYAYHLNQSNLVDPTQVQVNEPGRSVYLRVRAVF